MRWKELFLVPDHKVANIDGTSYDGFYYICFEKSSSKFEGYYYHSSSEKYKHFDQKVNLCFLTSLSGFKN